MGHRDPRMTLRVYTDVTGMKPQTRMGGLVGDDEWAPFGHQEAQDGGQRDETAAEEKPNVPQMQARRGGATERERRDSNPRPPA